jgi:hypothetical protein
MFQKMTVIFKNKTEYCRFFFTKKEMIIPNNSYNSYNIVYKENSLVKRAVKPSLGSTLLPCYTTVIEIISRSSHDWVSEDEIVIDIWNGHTTKYLIRFMVSQLFSTYTVEKKECVESLFMKQINGEKFYKYM